MARRGGGAGGLAVRDDAHGLRRRDGHEGAGDGQLGVLRRRTARRRWRRRVRVTSPSTVGAVVLMVRSAPSRLTLTALARLTLMTDPFCTWESTEGETRSAGCSSTLAPLTTWPTVPPKVWTELTLPSTLSVTVLLLPTKATRPEHECHEHYKLGADLDEAELAVRCEELDHDCPYLLDHPGTGKSAQDHPPQTPQGQLRTGPAVRRHVRTATLTNESAHVISAPRCAPCSE